VGECRSYEWTVSHRRKRGADSGGYWAYRLQQAEELLRLGIRQDASTFVHAREDGQPIQPRSLTHAWQQAVSRTGLPRIRFHDLRHAHATHLLSSGVHPKVASERLGHSRVGITLDLYSHVLPGMQEDAAARVDDALRQALQRRAQEALGSKPVANGLSASPGMAK
jgi:integrase